MRTAKVKASLRISVVSPGHRLFANVSSRRRGQFSQRTRRAALIRGRACVLKDWFDGKSEEHFLAMRFYLFTYLLHFVLFFSDLCALFLVACLTLSDAVDVKVIKTKSVGKKGDKFLLKGSCIFRIKENIPQAQFTIDFDKSTTKFKVSTIWEYLVPVKQI